MTLATGCGVFADSYGGGEAVIPVDAHIAGWPPSPTDILRGMLAAVDMTHGRRTRALATRERRADDHARSVGRVLAHGCGLPGGRRSISAWPSGLGHHHRQHPHWHRTGKAGRLRYRGQEAERQGPFATVGQPSSRGELKPILDTLAVERLSAKADRLRFRLKVGLRLKPPEAAPAAEPAQGSVGAVTLNPSSS